MKNRHFGVNVIILCTIAIFIAAMSYAGCASKAETKTEIKTVESIPIERLYYSNINHQVYTAMSNALSYNGLSCVYYHNYILYHSVEEGFYYYDENDIKQTISEDELKGNVS